MDEFTFSPNPLRLISPRHVSSVTIQNTALNYVGGMNVDVGMHEGLTLMQLTRETSNQRITIQLSFNETEIFLE